MKLLLDTHALYWWMIEEKRLSLNARKAIQSRASQLFVSPASAYELAYKHREGLLPEAGALVRNFDAEMLEEGFQPLQLQSSTAGAQANWLITMAIRSIACSPHKRSSRAWRL